MWNLISSGDLQGFQRGCIDDAVGFQALGFLEASQSIFGFGVHDSVDFSAIVTDFVQSSLNLFDGILFHSGFFYSFVLDGIGGGGVILALPQSLAVSTSRSHTLSISRAVVVPAISIVVHKVIADAVSIGVHIVLPALGISAAAIGRRGCRNGGSYCQSS